MVYFIQICPGVTVFDDSTGHCSLDLSCLKDSTDSTKQEASTKVPANCSAGDGNYSDPSDCHKFYMCSNGNPYTFVSRLTLLLRIKQFQCVIKIVSAAIIMINRITLCLFRSAHQAWYITPDLAFAIGPRTSHTAWLTTHETFIENPRIFLVSVFNERIAIELVNKGQKRYFCNTNFSSLEISPRRVVKR